MAGGLPVIDLDDFPRQSQKLMDACKEWGCFRVINHKIPIDLMKEMRSMAEDLLDLPTEIKQRNGDVIAGSGYMAPSEINPFYEALGLYNICSSKAMSDFCAQLDASPRNCEIMKRYGEAISKLAKDIACKLAKSMGLPTAVCDDLFEGWPCQFRINKYNFSLATVGFSGVQMHTDSSFLTLLLEDDNVGGLEIVDKSGEFVSVDPIPGTLLVNLGDVATVWSNGRFYNVKHRVQCKEGSKRLSIATFLLAPRNALVEAPSEFVDTEHPRLFVPFTYEEFRQLRISKKLQAGEVLDMLRIK
ncbi:2-oxoglutarate-dependent dioxygenase DAO-like [Malania oleifera]|uniref:2-oxoglutarate-dependent dioxygenase DAO-like n=1 Tax=Malania oleifera TaxID=397392 RepID=UPI0025AEB42F|nr:2-oxoglutarate-dependent dioxygenase DAO-like [Malania oleifera]